MSALSWRPVRPWQHWRFALTVTLCWVAQKHFPRLERSGRYDFYKCRVCGSNMVDTRTRGDRG